MPAEVRTRELPIRRGDHELTAIGTVGVDASGTFVGEPSYSVQDVDNIELEEHEKESLKILLSMTTEDDLEEEDMEEEEEEIDEDDFEEANPDEEDEEEESDKKA